MPRGVTLLLALLTKGNSTIYLLLDDDKVNPPTEAQEALPSRSGTSAIVLETG